MIEILTKIMNNSIDNFEDILLSKNYFRLEIEIPKKYYKFYNSYYDSYSSWIPFNYSFKRQFRLNVVLCAKMLNRDVLKIINEL